MRRYIEGIFDFEISYRNCNTFTYQDLSKWIDDKKPDMYIVEIQYPGLSNFKQVEINPNIINILKDNGEQLKLIDGVYCFKYDNYGIEYYKHSGIACELDCKLKALIAKASLQNMNDYVEINKIKFYLESFYINASLNKLEQAIKFYNLAEEALSCVKCNC